MVLLQQLFPQVSYCHQFLFQVLVRVEHVPHFFVSIPQEKKPLLFTIYLKKKKKKKKILHCTVSIKTNF